MLLGFTAFAESNSDIKVIDDNSSIYSDFAILGLNPDDYYSVFDETKPENLEYYDHFDKWYIIAMAENYVEQENQIQTYFYLYSPIPHQYQESGPYYLRNIQSLTYKLNGKEDECLQIRLIDQNDRGIIKIKGFSYAYTPTAEIELKEMVLYCCLESKKVTTSFKATSTHTQTDGFVINLYFNSTLIINEMETVTVEVPKEYASLFNTLSDIWEDFWLGTRLLYLTFYNFNFPDNIKPDKIDYAKFRYDSVYQSKVMKNEVITSLVESRKEIIKELEPGTHIYQANNRSAELEFETFVLGNRIDKGEFGYLRFTDEQKDLFKYDCSILLESHINTFQVSTLEDYSTITTSKITRTENIDFLELWYTKDEIQYRCQIATPTIDEPEQIKPGVKRPWYIVFWELMIKIGTFFLGLFGQSAPKIVCGCLGIGISVIGVFIVILLLPIVIQFLVSLVTSILKILF